MFRSKPPAEVAAGRRARFGLIRAWTMAARIARLAIGVPDYERYAAHVRQHHPDQVPMDREAFFRERMQARYGRGRSRCC